MSQNSGFFESKWDETIINPETETLGDWDIKYYYNQFADYFAKFFGNGVYYNPDNNLKVLSTGGMSVQVKAGWGFINGFWYNLDEDTILQIPANATAYTRTDSVILRWSLTNRAITLVYASDTVEPTRNDTIYDLVLAQVSVISGASSILGDVITDTRPNVELCGIVRGLEADAIDTDTLFAQYDAIFNEWFDGIKDQLVGDLAVKVQLEYEKMQSDIDEYYANSQQLITQYQEGLDDTVAQYEQNLADQIVEYNTNYQQILSSAQQSVVNATALVAEYVEKDFVIPEQDFIFVDNVCTIQDERISPSSLVDVYFTEDAVDWAASAIIKVKPIGGAITLLSTFAPAVTLSGSIRVRNR